MVVELWLYPDGSRILELSTKCAPAEAFNVAAETRAYLAGRGVVLTGRPADQDANSARVLRQGAGEDGGAEGDLTEAARRAARSRGFGCGDS